MDIILKNLVIIKNNLNKLMDTIKTIEDLEKSVNYYNSLERKAEILTTNAGIVTHIRNREHCETGEISELIKEKDKLFYSNFDYEEIRKKLMPNLREILEKHRLERISVPKKVFVEKNDNLREFIKEVTKERRRLYYRFSQFLDIQSKPDEKIINITSLENVDFNKPCSIEELEEIKEKYDYYIYPDCIDEINCDIKTKENDGVDLYRLGYGEKNNVTSDISESFMKKSERITEECYSEFFKKLDKNIGQGCRVRRRVLFEKLEIERSTNLNRYQLYFKSNFGINI